MVVTVWFSIGSDAFWFVYIVRCTVVGRLWSGPRWLPVPLTLLLIAPGLWLQVMRLPALVADVVVTLRPVYCLPVGFDLITSC